MPEVHGFAPARMARMKHPQIRCIYITAYDAPTTEAIGPILQKPFAVSVRIAEIEKIRDATRSA
jgi:hypothetical protein